MIILNCLRLATLMLTTPALCQVARPLVYPEFSKQIFTPPKEMGRNGTEPLFGYSITYQPTNKSLIVSSPTADTIGQLFTCNIDLNKCVNIRVPKVDRMDVVTHDYWLGATVKASSSFFMVCAPRAVKRTNTNSYGTFGRCFYQHLGVLLPATPLDLATIVDDAKIQHPDGKMKFEYTMDSFGWSMAVADDDTTLIGGPAMSIGRVMVYPEGVQSNTPNLIAVDNAAFRKSNGSVLFNFGYSIASGNFFNGTSYAISSTYGEIGNGKVLFFNSGLVYLEEATIVSDEVGSLFGAALCAAALSGAEASLLVGAPAFAPTADPGGSPRDQVGAVHVYAVYRFTKMRRIRTVVGSKEGSYFGHAIVNVGDLNGDGKDDVVIAAPYEEEGRGAVFVYSGAELFKDEGEFEKVVYLQKIMGEGPGQNLGVSLSVLKDYDENGCNELAIGIPGANKVMLLRCMASVTINVHAQFPDLKNHDDNFFILQPCLNMTYSDKPRNIQTEILVTVEVSHPNVTVADEDKTFVARLIERQPVYCKLVRVMMPEDGDYDVPIIFNITAAYDEPTTFAPDRVVVSENSNRSLTRNVWAPGSNLTFLVTTTMLDGYVIGSTESETITVRIRNSGRVAYGACVRVRVRGAAVRAPAECARAHDGNEVKCTLQEPLAKFGFMISEILIETKSMTSASKSVEIYAQLFINCKLPSGKPYENSISLRNDLDGIVVKGATNPGLIINITKTELTFGLQDIQHVYTIINNGVTNWEIIECDITLPTQVTSTVSIDNMKGCQIDNKGARCIINHLQKNDTINIIIGLYIVPGTTKDKILSTNSSIHTHLNLRLGSVQKLYSVSTQIKVLDAEVPLWIIIVSAIVGFIILLITAWILHECGCLRRKNKEKLLKLKKEVRRQSIRRSMKLRESMIVAVANQIADDRQKLIALQEESEAKGSDGDKPTAEQTDVYVVSQAGNKIVTRADVH